MGGKDPGVGGGGLLGAELYLGYGEVYGTRRRFYPGYKGTLVGRGGTDGSGRWKRWVSGGRRRVVRVGSHATLLCNLWACTRKFFVSFSDQPLHKFRCVLFYHFCLVFSSIERRECTKLECYFPDYYPEFP